MHAEHIEHIKKVIVEKTDDESPTLPDDGGPRPSAFLSPIVEEIKSSPTTSSSRKNKIRHRNEPREDEIDKNEQRDEESPSPIPSIHTSTNSELGRTKCAWPGRGSRSRRVQQHAVNHRPGKRMILRTPHCHSRKGLCS